MPSLFTSTRRLGHGAVLCLLMAGLGVQGLSQAVERVAAPSHSHLPSTARAAERVHVVAVETRSFARDDHRSIPWIGGEPDTVADAAHVHGVVAAHWHALGDEDVIYVDAEGDVSGAGAKPVAAAGCPLPATAPRVARPLDEAHADWREAAGWHALALTGEPLERPPR